MESEQLSRYLEQLGQQARAASFGLRDASTAAKNLALRTLGKLLLEHAERLIAANQRDVAAALAAGSDPAFVDRLAVRAKDVPHWVESLEQVAALPDPVGQLDGFSRQPSGIEVGKMRIPLGVVAMVYESRPNVTVEAASLCLKSGNAVLLRGGSESTYSNELLMQLISQALAAAQLPAHAVQMVTQGGREAVAQLARLDRYVDVLIPRGGKGLIERIAQVATVPVLKHLDGNCHMYIDHSADAAMALQLVINAKTQRYGACNTLETLLIHRQRVADVGTALHAQLSQAGVELRVCSQLLPLWPGAKLATEEDWWAEYLAPVLAVRVVEDLDQAIEHIEHYGSHHTDAIVTEHYPSAMKFVQQVDSASVMVNASTRFADGFEFGLGAEIGISTNKLHARGPVGLMGLTTEKFVVLGQGQVRL